MITLDRIRRILQENKEVLKKEYKVREIGVFGSYVKGEQKIKSDVDILVDFYEPISLFRFMHLANFLSDMMGLKVDLVMKNALKPRLGRRILSEVVKI
jgi:hypothetical protein